MDGSSTETIIGALRVLARDIQTDDGVINGCLHEAADRLEYLAEEIWLSGEMHNANTLHIAKVETECDNLRHAIQKTIDDNLYLADGEVCTLIDLKRVMRGDFSPWTRIDYADPSTYPDENRPCIVAWEFHPEHPGRHAMHVFNDVGDDMRLWQNAIGDEVHDWDGTIENPTHWMYAPDYQS